MDLGIIPGVSAAVYNRNLRESDYGPRATACIRNASQAKAVFRRYAWLIYTHFNVQSYGVDGPVSDWKRHMRFLREQMVRAKRVYMDAVARCDREHGREEYEREGRRNVLAVEHAAARALYYLSGDPQALAGRWRREPLLEALRTALARIGVDGRYRPGEWAPGDRQRFNRMYIDTL